MDAGRKKTLAERLQALEDIEEIRTLRNLYHHFINQGLYERLVELFTEDGYVDFGYLSKPAKGSEELNALFMHIPTTLDFVKQFIHNHIVEVSGDEATGVSYLEARYAMDLESMMVAAKYDDKYRRTVAGWKFSEMHLQLYFSTPLQKGWAGEEKNFIKPYT